MFLTICVLCFNRNCIRLRMSTCISCLHVSLTLLLSHIQPKSSFDSKSNIILEYVIIFSFRFILGNIYTKIFLSPSWKHIHIGHRIRILIHIRIHIYNLIFTFNIHFRVHFFSCICFVVFFETVSRINSLSWIRSFFNGDVNDKKKRSHKESYQKEIISNWILFREVRHRILACRLRFRSIIFLFYFL